MAQIMIEETKLKNVVLGVLNDLFNIGDIEEARKTPIGRLISLEAKVESLASEVRHLEQSLRSEMKSLEKTVDARFDAMMTRIDALAARQVFQEKLLYVVLVTVIGGLIKVVFFP